MAPCRLSLSLQAETRWVVASQQFTPTQKRSWLAHLPLQHRRTTGCDQTKSQTPSGDFPRLPATPCRPQFSLTLTPLFNSHYPPPERCCCLKRENLFIRDTKPRTNTTRGGRRARHPKTTLPHRPPGVCKILGDGGNANRHCCLLSHWLCRSVATVKTASPTQFWTCLHSTLRKEDSAATSTLSFIAPCWRQSLLCEVSNAPLPRRPPASSAAATQSSQPPRCSAVTPALTASSRRRTPAVLGAQATSSRTGQLMPRAIRCCASSRRCSHD